MKKYLSLKLLLTTCFCYCFGQLMAQQVISYNTNQHKFYLTTPTIKLQKIQGYGSFTRLFFETGDGHFKIFNTNTNKQQGFQMDWHFSSPNTTVPVAHLVTFYDTIKPRPQLASARFDPTPVSVGNNQNVAQLTGNEKIKIISATNTLTPGDSLPIAIVVNPEKSLVGADPEFPTFNRVLVVLFTNGGDNPDMFNSFDGNPLLPTKPEYRMARLHQNWNIIQLENLPGDVKQKVEALKLNGGYNNMLLIERPLTTTANTLENNLFFTMISSSNTNLYKSEYTAGINAVQILYHDNNTTIQIDEHSFVFDLDLYSRDPNKIRTIPNCIGKISSQQVPRIKYELEFENEGAASAQKILVDVKIPKGFQFPMDKITDVTCSLGGQQIPLSFSSLLPGLNKASRAGFYKYQPGERTIRFTINNAALNGRIAQEGNPTLGIGQISFSVPLQPGIQLQDCLVSVMTVTFDANQNLVRSFITRKKCGDRAPCPSEANIELPIQ